MNRLKIRSRVTEPTIWVGKEGVTQRLLEQVEKQLESRQLVKLKVQKSTATKSETINVAKEVSTATESTIVDVIGHTFTLYKKKSESKITLKQGST